MPPKALPLLLMSLALTGLAACGSTTASRDGLGSTATALAPGNSTSGDAGRQIEARIIGAMAGGLIGGQIGRGLDAQDRRKALEAEYRALEYTGSGQPVTWKGSGSRTGEVVAAQPYSVGSQNCRQYTHTIYVGLEPQSARGTACRNTDGSWTPLT